MERSTADAINPCHRVLSQRRSAQWILEGDIRACFDSFAHDWLLAHIPMERVILQKWLKAGFRDKHLLQPTAAGVPQGGVLSPVLMNLALTGLERHRHDAFPAYQGRHRTQVHVIRFADDCVITGRSKDMLEQDVRPLVEQFLAERGLERSQEKPRSTHIEEGCDLLGTHIRTYRGKLLCTPAKKNVRTFLETIRRIGKGHKQAITGNLILQRNPVMRGWAQSHQHGASKRTFAYVDHHLFPLVWPWARQRHPQHALSWIREKYFRSAEGNHWVFFGQVMRADGTFQDVRLFRASSVPRQRHTTITGEANPYDSQWEPYFEARLGVRMAHNLRGRRSLLRLRKEQEGLCAVCHQRITQLTGWHPSYCVTHSRRHRSC